MKNVTLISLLVLLSLSSFSCMGRRYEKTETVEYKINTSGKTKITLDNVNGIIKVMKGDSSAGLIVKAEKIAKVRKKDLDKPLDKVKVVIDTASNEIKISGEYEKSKGFSFNFSFKSPKINYELFVPENIKLNIDNVNGNAEFTDISNELNVTLVNGNVNLENVSGKNEFDITNGSLIGTLDSTNGLKIDIVNGSVNINLAKTFKAEIKADVTNGKINYENLNMSDLTSERKMLRGFIGNSEKEVRIDVVNGKINLIGK